MILIVTEQEKEEGGERNPDPHHPQALLQTAREEGKEKEA